ncbi:diuretic hormone receptor, partial [Danaus plexippus plexippus]
MFAVEVLSFDKLEHKPHANNLIMELHTLPGPEAVAENASEECLARNSNYSENYCQPYFDGLLCWDATPWNTLAVQKCFSEFHGVQDLRCLRNTIHTNLMSTYILSACSWMLNLALQNWSDEAQQEQTSCMILVICMHYFYLTNFFWMLVEGLYLYMLVVETFTAENIKLKVYTTIGWGAPAIFITIWVIARCFVSVVPSTGPDGLTITGETKMCQWIHEHQVDWIHKAPALVGLALNLFFLIRIMWVLITKLRSANTLETEQYRKATKALLVLIPLLGITNLLVLCGPSDDSWFAYTFDYTRAVMLSTQ